MNLANPDRMQVMRTDEVLELMRQVAAEVITPRFKALGGDQVDQKSPGDYVTIADQEAEQLITAALHDRVPGCLVVGEEASFADPRVMTGLASAEIAYTVDPVDGTSNFVRGSTTYAVMIAEVRSGQVTRSWIYHPEFDRAYVAERGAGVELDGQPLTRPQLNDPLRGGGAKKSRAEFDFDPGFAQMSDSNYCAGFDYPQLIAGQTDFFCYRRAKPWDHLPGLLMVTELGGTTLEVDRTPYGPATGPRSTIVTSLYPEIATQVTKAWRDGIDDAGKAAGAR